MPKPFFENERRKHRANKYTQRAKWGDKNWRRKHIRDEIRDFAYNHSLVRNELVDMPAHHTGFWRYARRSDAIPLSLAAPMRPFFVIIKLVPMAALELNASIRPIHLSCVKDVMRERCYV